MNPGAVEFLQAGIKATSVRQSVIANNIANIHTPGFRRGSVQFESLLNDALRAGQAKDPSQVQPQILQADSPADPTSNDVNLDLEVGELVKNTTMYKTYFRLLGKLVRQMEMAMGG